MQFTLCNHKPLIQKFFKAIEEKCSNIKRKKRKVKRESKNEMKKKKKKKKKKKIYR